MARNKEKFEFHKIGNNVASGWVCLVDTYSKLLTVGDSIGVQSAIIWQDIKRSPQDKDGHCRTREASCIKTLLGLEMEKREISTMSMPECIFFITNLKMQALEEIFNREGAVYISKNGGCRPSVELLDNEEILEKCTSSSFVFPVTDDEIDIIKWPGGNHFYVQVDGKNVSIEGQHKWNTVKSAEVAIKQYMREIKYTDS